MWFIHIICMWFCISNMDMYCMANSHNYTSTSNVPIGSDSDWSVDTTCDTVDTSCWSCWHQLILLFPVSIPSLHTPSDHFILKLCHNLVTTWITSRITIKSPTVQSVQTPSPWYGWAGSCDLVWSTTLTVYKCTHFVKMQYNYSFKVRIYNWQTPSMLTDCRTFQLHRFSLTVYSFVLPAWPKHLPIMILWYALAHVSQ